MSTLLPLAQLKTITKRNDVRVAEEPAPAWLTREWWQQALAQLPERVCERVDHVLLTHQCFERARTPLAGKDLVTHR